MAVLAKRLGFDTSYVWRVMNGQRSGVSPGFLAATERLIHEPVTVVGAAASWRELDGVLERAIHAFHSGQLRNAEFMLTRVYETAGDGAHERYLAARAKQWRAGILRDRNVIQRDRKTGEPGAVDLYTQVRDEWRVIDPESVVETRLMLGACQEMLRRNESALAEYCSLLDGADSDRLKARLSSRTGAIMTKMGKRGPARAHLDRAVRVSRHLDEAGPYSFAQEKLAIWLIRDGSLEEASAALEESARVIPRPSALRQIQSLLVQADLRSEQGEPSESMDLLREASRISAEVGYEHQGAIIAVRILQLEEPG